MTDDDLLAQLAEAELDQDDYLGGGNPGEKDSQNVISGLPSSSARTGAAIAKNYTVFTGDKSSGVGAPVEETVEFDLDYDLPDAGASGKEEVGGGKTNDDASGEMGGAEVRQLSSVSTSVEATVSNNDVDSSKPKLPVGGAKGFQGKAGAKPVAGSLEDDLSELEALERELGIMGVGAEGAGERGGGSIGGGQGALGGDASKDDAFDVDNLDELEGYLESLAK